MGSKLGRGPEDKEGTGRAIETEMVELESRHRLAGEIPEQATPPPGVYEESHYKALARYQGLRKHESSLLIQVRTGKVGLRAFLFEKKVPGIATPL